MSISIIGPRRLIGPWKNERLYFVWLGDYWVAVMALCEDDALNVVRDLV